MTPRDDNLKQFATPRQWEVLLACWEEGSDRKAAKKLGVTRNIPQQARKSVLQKAARAGYAPEYDHTHAAPPGFQLKGASTLYDLRSGEPVMQWVKTKQDESAQLEHLIDAVRGIADELPRIAPARGPASTRSDLLACYPIGDHHLGMYAWGEETGGDDYDLKIAEERLNGAIDYLVNAAPPADQALVAFLGDYFHYDSFVAETPANRHRLDADSRFPKMVRVALRAARYSIGAALRRHARVQVIVEIGNHDLAASIFLMEILSALYEREPRVTIDTSPRRVHYHEFGKNLIGTHHGHDVKAADLPLLMAADQPDAWGRTVHRVWWTGHVHHDRVRDFNGVKVESFQVLAPADAWSAHQGYRARSSMKGIVLHAEHGEIARHTVHPGLL